MKQRFPWLTLATVGPAVAVHSLPVANPLLQYERTAISQGEPWRLFTCHWCHISTSHLFWNAALIVVAGVILERQSPREFLRTFALGLLTIGPLLFVALPDMASFVGLSGIVAALITAATVKGIIKRDNTTWVWVSIAALLVTKIAFEIVDPKPILTNVDSHQSVPLAHLAGMMAGLLGARLRSTKPLDTPVA